jgi:hypothetical protein
MIFLERIIFGSYILAADPFNFKTLFAMLVVQTVEVFVNPNHRRLRNLFLKMKPKA